MWDAGQVASGVEGCRKGEIQEMIDANLVMKRAQIRKDESKGRNWD